MIRAWAGMAIIQNMAASASSFFMLIPPRFRFSAYETVLSIIFAKKQLSPLL